jgi:hypothetical protein
MDKVEKKIEFTNPKRECYYPDCLQCCCDNSEKHCEYDAIENENKGSYGAVRGLFNLVAFIIGITTLVLFLIKLWPNG